jgi:hypothetical protein
MTANFQQTSPFKFLDSYTQADKEIFFGRQAETEELYSRLFYSKLLLVYGPSGSGKTSLLQCGVANRFGQQNWKPLFIRRKQNIIDSIHAELKKQAITPVKTEKTISEKLYSLYLDYLTPVYLIFDQFEELFIFGSEDEKEAFVTILREISDHEELNTQIILSIREEYLASLSGFEDRLPKLFENRIRIEKMKKTHALEAIEGPCRVADVELEEGVSEKVMERLSAKSGYVELTWLQVLMDNLYKKGKARDPNQVIITIEDVEQLGKIGDVLGNFLDEQLKAMPDGVQGEALLKAMITTEGTKKQLTPEEIETAIQSLGQQISREKILMLLQHLINVRIISDQDENGRYELKHDSLAAKIYEKLTLYEKELMEVRQFIESAYLGYLSREKYLTEDDLNYIKPFEQKIIVGKDLNDFILKSKEIIINRQKSKVRMIWYSFFAFILLLVSGLFTGLVEIREFMINNRVSQIVTKRAGDREEALKNSIQLYKKYEDPRAYYALFDAFYSVYQKNKNENLKGDKFYPFVKTVSQALITDEIEKIAVSDGDRFIYGWLADSSVFIIGFKGNQYYNRIKMESLPVSIKMNTDVIAAIGSDSVLSVWDIKGSLLKKERVHLFGRNPDYSWQLSESIEVIAYISDSNAITFIDQAGQKTAELFTAINNLSAFKISKNGKFLVAASDNGFFESFKIEQDLSFQKIASGPIHKNSIFSVEFSENDLWILTSSADSTVMLHNLFGKESLTCIRSPGASLMAEFTSNDRFIRLMYEENNNQYFQIVFKPDLKWFFHYRHEVLELSKDAKLTLVQNENEDNIELTIYHLIKFYYILPFDIGLFSHCGNYLIAAGMNGVEVIPVNPDLIIDIFER